MVMGLPKILKSQTLLSVLIDYQDTLSRHTMTLHTHYDTLTLLSVLIDYHDTLSRHTMPKCVQCIKTHHADTPSRHTMPTRSRHTIKTLSRHTIPTLLY